MKFLYLFALIALSLGAYNEKDAERYVYSCAYSNCGRLSTGACGAAGRDIKVRNIQAVDYF
jgi:hypothetical protein